VDAGYLKKMLRGCGSSLSALLFKNLQNGITREVLVSEYPIDTPKVLG